MPECSTVELIGEPSRPEVLALDMFIIRGAVCWGGWCVLTIYITLITHRSASTLGLLWKVAAHERSVEHGGSWVISLLWAHNMLSMMLSLEAVPELPAIIFIWIVAWTVLVSTTIDNLVRRAAVWLLGGGG